MQARRTFRFTIPLRPAITCLKYAAIFNIRFTIIDLKKPGYSLRKKDEQLRPVFYGVLYHFRSSSNQRYSPLCKTPTSALANT